MKRRAFMNWVGVSFMATSLPVAIAACSPADTDDTAATEAEPGADTATEEVDSSIRDDGFAALGTTEELDSVGFLASKTFVAGSVIVIRDPDNAEGVVALDSLCTHQGCHVAWEATEFVCPCHASKFSASGEVANGPATEPLGTYESKVEEGLVLIKAA